MRTIENQYGRQRDEGRQSAPSPHELGAARYLERYGSLTSEAARWRLVAMVSVLMVLVLLWGFVHLSGQSGVQPYVIQVDEHGTAVAMGLPQATAPGGDTEVRSAVGRFVVNLRRVSSDLSAIGYTMTIAYAMAAEGSPALKKVQKREQELVQDGAARLPVHVRVTGIERQGASDEYRVEFVETHASQMGSQRRRLTAYVTAKASTRKYFDSSAQLVWNPGRIYVTDFTLTDHGVIEEAPLQAAGESR